MFEIFTQVISMILCLIFFKSKNENTFAISGKIPFWVLDTILRNITKKILKLMKSRLDCNMMNGAEQTFSIINLQIIETKQLLSLKLQITLLTLY